ncbi:hypothetical protein PanWU01x14_322050 [Parasponia andersonii]|uniref:Uncharacterized protein n=1 Tax=Parasponia andersonii TaxID=3476 RepID=A0A2P5AL04_PARAD|nr:hypothetical protein PanWU01x14_322050 [Parasponia andersonii]
MGSFSRRVRKMRSCPINHLRHLDHDCPKLLLELEQHLGFLHWLVEQPGFEHHLGYLIEQQHHLGYAVDAVEQPGFLHRLEEHTGCLHQLLVNSGSSGK